MKGGIETMLNPVKLVDWMYLYKNASDARARFMIRTDNETFPESLRLRSTDIPDLNMRIRKGNLDSIFERIIDHVTPVFGADITDKTIMLYPETQGFCIMNYHEYDPGIDLEPLGVLIEIFLKPEEEKKDD